MKNPFCDPCERSWQLEITESCDLKYGHFILQVNKFSLLAIFMNVNPWEEPSLIIGWTRPKSGIVGSVLLTNPNSGTLIPLVCLSKIDLGSEIVEVLLPLDFLQWIYHIVALIKLNENQSQSIAVAPQRERRVCIFSGIRSPYQT